MTKPETAHKMLGMQNPWEIEYLRHVEKVDGRSLSAIAKAANIAPTTLTRPVNDEKHKYSIKLQTLEAVRQETGIDFIEFQKRAVQQQGFSEPANKSTLARRVLESLDNPTEEPATTDFRVGTDGNLVQIVATVNKEGIDRLIRKLEAMKLLLDD